MLKKIFSLLFTVHCSLFTVLCSLLISCVPLPSNNAENIEIPPETEIPAPPEDDYLTIVAVGDNLYHNVMIRDGEEGDYDSIYTEMLPFLEPADITFINQETLLAGKDFGFTGYPQFNSPQNVGRAVATAGFNVVNHANNHVMDKGERAVFVTMDFWDTFPDITVLGIHRSQELRGQPTLVRKNNITMGFLSYTYGTNGIPVPRDKPYLVSLINTEIMAKEIDAIRPLCEFLIVSMHWGEEYQHVYNKSQKDLATFLAEHKVDLVLGHHPHVIQPMEYITRPDGRAMLCFFSLGNFASAQIRNPTLLGAMAYIRIRKPTAQNGETTNIMFMDAGAIPVVTHYDADFTNFKVYPLYAYTPELLKKHRQSVDRGFTIDYLTGTASRVFGGNELLRNPFLNQVLTIP